MLLAQMQERCYLLRLYLQVKTAKKNHRCILIQLLCSDSWMDPTGIPERNWVIATSVRSDDIDLESQGINKEQAKALRASLATFSDDWDSPEMSVYDTYDAAKANR